MTPAAARDALGQELEIELIRALARHVRARYFVDVGAEKGLFAQAMFECGLRGALFEPMPRHRAALQALAARHDSRAYEYAIDETDGDRELFVATGADGVELDFFHSLERLDGAAQFRHSRSLRVHCRSLQSLLRDGVLPPAVGILKTDTEGHDAQVLRGMGALRPELVVCEYFTEGLYPGWNGAHPHVAIELMRERGYARYLATKRVGEFEYCSASPAAFLPRQWGNLFFLTEELFAASEETLVAFLARVESGFLAEMEAIASDRVAKEAVIQGLLGR